MAILFAPLFGRHGEPDCESFGEILIRMSLRVPIGKMADETLAVGARLVGFRQVLRLGASKSFSPIVARGQAVSVIDGMSALVPQELLAPLGRSAFDLQHLAQLEGLQAGMSEIKRNCDGRDASRREPT